MDEHLSERGSLSEQQEIALEFLESAERDVDRCWQDILANCEDCFDVHVKQIIRHLENARKEVF